MTDPLVAFLRARFDDDGHVAQGLVGAARMLQGKPDFYGVGGPAAEAFWDRFDPARVCRDLDAKRAILDVHVARGECIRCEWFDGELYPCDTIKLLASVYASHPEYRNAWAL